VESLPLQGHPYLSIGSASDPAACTAAFKCGTVQAVAGATRVQLVDGFQQCSPQDEGDERPRVGVNVIFCRVTRLVVVDHETPGTQPPKGQPREPECVTVRLHCCVSPSQVATDAPWVRERDAPPEGPCAGPGSCTLLPVSG
jgi:hypothetical protein